MICTSTLCRETNCGKFISVYQHYNYNYRVVICDMYYNITRLIYIKYMILCTFTFCKETNCGCGNFISVYQHYRYRIVICITITTYMVYAIAIPPAPPVVMISHQTA
jgi:hypothetical protein